MTSSFQTQKVIEALYDYKAQSPGELSFNVGSIFYVTKIENDDWYNVRDPQKLNKSGVVPIAYFKDITPARKESSASLLTTKDEEENLPFEANKRQSLTTLYGVVLYDFDPQHHDELEVTEGENIIICAHHDFEWFIAKPINRLGGPGLVPVNFISIINLKTKLPSVIDAKREILDSKLPTVQEWKTYNANYQASAKAIKANTQTPYYSQQQQQQQHQNQHQHQYQHQHQNQHQQQQQRPPQNYQYQQHQYQQQYSPQPSLDRSNSSKTNSTNIYELQAIYVLEAVIQEKYFVKDYPEGKAGKYYYSILTKLSNNSIRLINRSYDDFFELQAYLKQAFPREANEANRILPTIPGPLPIISDNIAEKRKDDLNDYLLKLLSLNEYISKCNLIVSFFNFKNDRDKELSSMSRLSQHQKERNSQYENNKNFNQLSRGFSNLSVQKPPSHQHQDSYQDSYQETITDHNINESTLTSSPKIKIKFYYKDDIFALQLAYNITVKNLRKLITERIDNSDFRLFPKSSRNVDETQFDPNDEVLTDDELKIKCLVEKGKILIV
ncbi:hypothetical protein PACTADRAFT_49892 [Pachysolen tannophilus NRRL Y-2460]|uniref:Bud emergence protein 1 n=1 Tax=Pachysolen tannophilus NRRL Y-2460 TaxID=669874 RepID=A0A1E4TTS4_PACTA|nr:hypothetical protein PACTADRAFT_49892 [Pachysolen tannophilus NRRL Y-2460]